MIELKLKQGTPEWLEHRTTCFNASEAPSMLGLSPYTSRDELLAYKKFGIEKNVDKKVEFIRGKGHIVEESARPIIEKQLKMKLFNIVGMDFIDGLRLGASFDGLDAAWLICFEHKLINAELRKVENAEQLPEHYRAQMEQQLMVSGAERCLFVASDGTENDMVQVWYESDPEMRDRIIKGWHQFKRDLLKFEMKHVEQKPIANEPELLPSIDFRVSGQIMVSNLADVKELTDKFINSINRDLRTDQDFADAELIVKRCNEFESKAKEAKEIALSGMADVSSAFKLIDSIIESFKRTRLELGKQIQYEKDHRKVLLIDETIDNAQEYIDELNDDIGIDVIPALSKINTRWHHVIKGKKTLATIKAALNDELAQFEIEFNELRDLIKSNLQLISSQGDEYQHLFPDLKSLVQQDPATVEAIIENRIMKDKAADEIKKENEQVHIPEEMRAAVELLNNMANQDADIPVDSEKEAADIMLDWSHQVEQIVINIPLSFFKHDKVKHKYISTRYQRILTSLEEINEKIEVKA